jgi:hypothetical protein
MPHHDSNHRLIPWIAILGMACAFFILFAAPLRAAPTMIPAVEAPLDAAALQAATAVSLAVDTIMDDAALQACTVAAGDCSLRGAIERANADPSNHYTITLPAGTYQLTLAPDATPDDNADGDLDIWGTLAIQGAGEASTFLQAGSSLGAGIDRILHLINSNAHLLLRDLTLRYGTAYGYGGGINNLGDLRLENVTVISNTVVAQDAAGVEGRGGGLYNGHQLRILNSTIRANQNTVDGTMVVDPGEVAGSGIYNGGGTLAITNTLIISNHTPFTGAGIFNWGGTLSITGSQIISNTARGTAGIYIYAGAAEINTSDVSSNLCTAFQSCGIQNHDLGTLNLKHSTVSANQGYSDGAGIYNTGAATITHSSIMSNSTQLGANGGGIYNSGTLVLAYSRIYTNTTRGGYGGGLYNTSGGVVTVSACAIYANSSNGGGGGVTNYVGSTMDIVNATIAGNFATGSGSGGGIINAGTLHLTSSTVSGNTASDAGGGIWASMGALNVANTIIAGNTSSSAADYDCAGAAITSQDYNLVGSGTGCPVAGHDQATSDANLGPLADNGGATPTQALLAGSPALEQIPDGVNGCSANVSIDQRGAVRAGGTNRGGTACDIGAYEYASDEQPSAVALQSFAARVSLLGPAALGILPVVCILLRRGFSRAKAARAWR